MCHILSTVYSRDLEACATSYQLFIPGILKHVPELSCEALEGAKCSLINLVGSELFNFAPPLVAGLMVVGQGDPRCSVSDAAESRLKKLRNSVDWEDDSVVVLLYGLCLGHDKLPAKVIKYFGS